MIFLKFYRFFMGKLKLEASGMFAERILNLCSHNGIGIWGIRKKNDKITFYIIVRDFFALRPIMAGTKIRIHILKKSGFPFVVKRYKRRYGLFAGIALFFATLQILSLFVWNINIAGNETVDSAEILAACRQIGIKEGAFSRNIDTQKLRLLLLSKVDGLAWAAINIEGCALTVDVTEEAKKKEHNNAPCNLVANGNGIIRRIEVSEGKSLVKVGDAVAEGQLLVSGIYEYKNGCTELKHSIAEITAEVYETVSATVPLKQEIKTLEEEKEKCYTLSFFGIKLPLYLGGFGKEYLREDEILRLENEKNYLPIYFHKSTFKKVEKRETTLSRETAEKMAKEQLDRQLKDVEIIEKSIDIRQNDDSVTVVYDIVALKNIAKEDFLLFSTTN